MCGLLFRGSTYCNASYAGYIVVYALRTACDAHCHNIMYMTDHATWHRHAYSMSNVALAMSEGQMENARAPHFIYEGLTCHGKTLLWSPSDLLVNAHWLADEGFQEGAWGIDERTSRATLRRTTSGVVCRATSRGHAATTGTSSGVGGDDGPQRLAGVESL